MMTAIEFVNEYTNLVEELDAILHPQFYPIIRNMYREDPHDLVEPHQCFPSRRSALGFVAGILIKRAKAMRDISTQSVVESAS